MLHKFESSIVANMHNKWFPSFSFFFLYYFIQKIESCTCSLFLGGYDRRLRENVEYLEELKNLAKREGVAGRVNFVTSCSTEERNSLLSQCLCVLYTPMVRWHLLFSRID